jgi:hypothetical protein
MKDNLEMLIEAINEFQDENKSSETKENQSDDLLEAILEFQGISNSKMRGEK